MRALAGGRLVLIVQIDQVVETRNREDFLVTNAAVRVQHIEAEAVVIADLRAGRIEPRGVRENGIAGACSLSVAVVLIALIVINIADAIGVAVGEQTDELRELGRIKLDQLFAIWKVDNLADAGVVALFRGRARPAIASTRPR